MEPYRSRIRKSGVTEFQPGDDWIKVRFHGAGVYLYTYRSTGRINVERMKVLARAGRGLSSFISRVVKDEFESKEE